MTRRSNFELLRIFLMLTIPLYHLCVYSGLMYVSYNQYTVISLAMCSGGAIVADFAFMSLSSYFLLERGCEKVNLKDLTYKFLTVTCQVGFIWIIKEIVFRSLWGLEIENDFVDEMLRPGVWWFVKVYLVILLVYPLLNRAIESLTKAWHLVIVVVLGFVVTINGLTNNLSLASDFVSFFFTYFVMGYLRRSDYNRFFGIKVKPVNMLVIYLVIYLITLVLCSLMKKSDGSILFVIPQPEMTNEFVKRLIGKYWIFQAVMGLAIFLCFKSLDIGIKPWINRVAKLTFYVFLLHEMVMGIFWKLGKLQTIDGVFAWNSIPEFLFWCLLYLTTSFLVALVACLIYDRGVKPWLNPLVGRLCKIDRS